VISMNLLDEPNGLATEATGSPCQCFTFVTGDLLLAKGIILEFLHRLISVHFRCKDVVQTKLSWKNILQKVDCVTLLCCVGHPL
jgi:hypothetical protein